MIGRTRYSRCSRVVVRERTKREDRSIRPYSQHNAHPARQALQRALTNPNFMLGPKANSLHRERPTRRSPQWELFNLLRTFFQLCAGIPFWSRLNKQNKSLVNCNIQWYSLLRVFVIYFLFFCLVHFKFQCLFPLFVIEKLLSIIFWLSKLILCI